MADLTITASQVLPGTGVTQANGTAGETITAGQPVYKDSTDSNHLKLAGAASTAAIATCVGISAHASLDGQPLTYYTAGLVTIGAGAAPAEGVMYTLSTTAGKITTDAIVSTEYLTYLGTANGSNQIDISLDVTGQQLA